MNQFAYEIGQTLDFVIEFEKKQICCKVENSVFLQQKYL